MDSRMEEDGGGSTRQNWTEANWSVQPGVTKHKSSQGDGTTVAQPEKISTANCSYAVAVILN